MKVSDGQYTAALTKKLTALNQVNEAMAHDTLQMAPQPPKILNQKKPNFQRGTAK